ncbi:hypothetical protein FRC06_005953 [Ceratobasidium sp. 370]|nr:hypothetical protein FRC06_005953 [Ceratobasidium sp. 370]
MIAGPLSGLVVQPIIGALADRSTSRWGRRRPYMLAGSVLTALSLIMLSRAQELAAWISGSKESSVGLARAIAILAVYLIDFAINVSMVAARTLTMDVLPTELQSASGAWASRMVGIGGVIGFYAEAFSKRGAALLENLRNLPRDVKSIMRQLKGAEAGTDEALRAEAARAGSHAMLYGAIVTLATSLILPRFIKDLRPEDANASRSRDGSQQTGGDPDAELEALLEESEPTTSPEQAQLTGDAPNRIGWFLGLQNVSLVLPMFICILMSATIFSILEPGRSVIGGGASGSSGEKRGHSMDIVLSVGGLCSLVSCFLTRKLLK